MTDKLGNRRLHIWRGNKREQDIVALADAIAATGELFNHNETIIQLNGDGKLVNINLAGLQEFIAGVRVVVSDGVARKDYFT